MRFESTSSLPKICLEEQFLLKFLFQSYRFLLTLLCYLLQFLKYVRIILETITECFRVQTIGFAYFQCCHTGYRLFMIQNKSSFSEISAVLQMAYLKLINFRNGNLQFAVEECRIKWSSNLDDILAIRITFLMLTKFDPEPF